MTTNPLEQCVSDIETLFALNLPIVDVRAPIEFEKGHIPGAMNIPLLTNEDRHQVGLCYRQFGHHKAVELGLELVGPRLGLLAKLGRDHSRNNQLIVYCQRGGKRSQSMSWLWSQLGIQVYRLAGGYKRFRHWTVQTISDSRRVLLLAGGTGVGKTEVLLALAEAGEAIVNLEGLAHHKGSAFGAIGEVPQPTQSHFENRLAVALSRVKSGDVVWFEAESRRIGCCQIPDTLWQQMITAPRIYLERDVTERIERLCLDYQEASSAELERALQGIQKRLGSETHLRALRCLHANDRQGVVEQVLSYYDRWYEKHKVAYQDQILESIDTSTMPHSDLIPYLKTLKDEKYGLIE